MKAVLVDDEHKSLQLLSSLLRQYCPALEVVGTANGVENGLAVIATRSPDLIFLDVLMPDGTGFDLIERLPHLNYEIVFVTSFDRYALQAIQCCALGYIVKPVDPTELMRVVNRAVEQSRLREDNQRNRQLLANLKDPSSRDNRIGIPSDRGLDFVRAGDIVRCEGVDRCTRVVLTGGSALLSSYNLGEFRKLLEAYNFFSPHKSHLINLDHIVRYDKDGTVEMIDRGQVPVSRRRRQEFLDRLVRL